MGSGATKFDSATPSAPTNTNICIDCQRKFRVIARKKRLCIECSSPICHRCLFLTNTDEMPVSASRLSLSHPNPAVGNCRSCHIMLSGDVTYDTLMRLKVKHLKAFLVRRNVQQVENCIEKSHLVELVLQRLGSVTNTDFIPQMEQIPRNDPAPEPEPDARVHPHPETPNSTDREGDTPNPTPPNTETRQNPPNNEDTGSATSTEKQETGSISKISLSEIENIDEVDNLTAKQLKIILLSNFVDYRGCKEKHELITKVKMLWESRQANQKLYERLVSQTEASGAPGKQEEVELCKICMDAPIDCVLLECGHMVTCTKCGKQMNECPICRQYVIRCVHIFKA